MRAIMVDEEGATPVARDVARPDLPADGVRLRMRAAGVNFADTLMIAGQYQVRPAAPFTPGFEAAGEVLEAGPEAADAPPPGTPVMALVDHGAWAEEVIARPADMVRLPAGMPWVTAATFGVAYGTAHLGLHHRAGVRPGESVLVTGAGGGVGLTAVEVARVLGATVIGCAGGDKLAAVERHGAHHTIDHRDQAIRDAARAVTGGAGPDVVYDPVGGEVFDAALRSAAQGARILTVGFASGTVPGIPANRLLVKNQTVIGYWFGAWRHLDPAAVRTALETLLGWWRDGRLAPEVWATYDLADFTAALDALRERRVTGRIALVPDGA